MASTILHCLALPIMIHTILRHTELIEMQ